MDAARGKERSGQLLAAQMAAGWEEYWPFLDRLYAFLCAAAITVGHFAIIIIIIIISIFHSTIVVVIVIDCISCTESTAGVIFQARRAWFF